MIDTSRLKIFILEQAGYRSAMQGIYLSYHSTNDKHAIAMKLASKDGGHNKFLEHLQTWWAITMPRGWWQQMDTYRVGVSKLSESTMHDQVKQPLIQENFVRDIPELFLESLNDKIQEGDWETVKDWLPEGFLQTREVNLNFKTLRNIILQRRSHKWGYWRYFCEKVVAQVAYPELLGIGEHNAKS